MSDKPFDPNDMSLAIAFEQQASGNDSVLHVRPDLLLPLINQEIANTKREIDRLTQAIDAIRSGQASEAATTTGNDILSSSSGEIEKAQSDLEKVNKGITKLEEDVQKLAPTLEREKGKFNELLMLNSGDLWNFCQKFSLQNLTGALESIKSAIEELTTDIRDERRKTETFGYRLFQGTGALDNARAEKTEETNREKSIRQMKYIVEDLLKEIAEFLERYDNGAAVIKYMQGEEPNKSSVFDIPAYISRSPRYERLQYFPVSESDITFGRSLLDNLRKFSELFYGMYRAYSDHITLQKSLETYNQEKSRLTTLVAELQARHTNLQVASENDQTQRTTALEAQTPDLQTQLLSHQKRLIELTGYFDQMLKRAVGG